MNRVASIEVYGSVNPANPATVAGTATVAAGGNTVDLTKNVSLNDATGAVTYEISGDAKGCALQGSVLTSGSGIGTSFL